jgi:hypothetical protein
MYKKYLFLLLTVLFVLFSLKIIYAQGSLSVPSLKLSSGKYTDAPNNKFQETKTLFNYSPSVKFLPKLNKSQYFEPVKLGDTTRDTKSSKISLSRTLAFTGFTIGASVFLHIFQQNAWWSGQREHFHIDYNWVYSLQMNNLGHMFVGQLISNTMKDAFDWCGFKPDMSMWMGTLYSFFYMTDIEIEDGFAKQWGFSPGDQTFGMAGQVWALGQYYLKPMQKVTLKWSYRPTNDPFHKGDFPDDYNGQTFWLSFNVYDFLPKAIQKIWPSFLNVAAGYGVDGYDDYRGDGRIQNFYLTFDYDLRRIIPGDSKFMLVVKNFINNFKFLPAPGLRWNYTQHRFEFTLHF